jgi:hypothetical protein
VDSFFQQQAEFIQESGVVVALVNILNAPPGTELRARLVKEERMIWNEGEGREDEIDFIPEMGADILTRGYREVVQYIDKPANLYDRTVTFLTRYQQPKGVSLSGQSIFNDIKPFLRSMYYLGFRDSSGRRYYWKLIFWTLRNRIGLFQLMIKLWMIAYYYRKIYEDDPSFAIEEQYHGMEQTSLIDEEKILTPV